MSGLQIVDDTEFTVQLKAPTIDFKQRFGVHAVLPAAGVGVQGHGRLRAATRSATVRTSWPRATRGSTTSTSTWCRTPATTATGHRKNKGLRFVFYANLDTAYADLQAGNLDVLDTIPPSALPTFRNDLGDRALTGPTAPEPDARHPAAADALRRRGGPAAPAGVVRGDQPASRSAIRSSADSRSPARDFTASSLPGFDPDLPGNDVLNYRPGPRQASCGRRRTRSRRGAASTSSPTTPTAATRSGWTRWPTASRTPWASTPSARRSRPSRDAHPDHRPQHRHRVPGRLAGRLPVDAGVPRAAVRHRRRLQRRRLLQPRVRRRADRRAGGALAARSPTA